MLEIRYRNNENIVIIVFQAVFRFNRASVIEAGMARLIIAAIV